LGSRAGSGGWTQHWVEVLDADAHVIGAGVSVYKELAQ